MPYFAVGGQSRDSDEARAASDPLLRVAERYGVTPAQVRLAWTLHRAPNVLAIPGTGNVSHLEENVAAASLSLTADDLALLASSTVKWPRAITGNRSVDLSRDRRPAGS